MKTWAELERRMSNPHYRALVEGLTVKSQELKTTILTPAPAHIPLRTELAIVQEEVKQKIKMQRATYDRLQWYRIEYGKLKCVNHELFDWIVSGGGFFINRSMRQEKFESIEEIEDSPVVKTLYPIKWFLMWVHKQKLPGFITYSANCFTRNGMVYRFVDADLKEMPQYLGKDMEDFTRILSEVCKVNLDQSGDGKLISMNDYYMFKKLLMRGADKVEQLLPGVAYVGYSGNGFRILMRATTKDELAKNIQDGIDKGLLDSCSKDLEYRAMRLCSFQSVKSHLQTDCDPRSLNFRYSNPAFFELRLTRELKELLVEYFKTYSKSSSMYKGLNVTYEMMRDKQKHIEAQVSELMNPSVRIPQEAVRMAAV